MSDPYPQNYTPHDVHEMQVRIKTLSGEISRLQKNEADLLARISELLVANNKEVERRRAVEERLRWHQEALKRLLKLP